MIKHLTVLIIGCLAGWPVLAQELHFIEYNHDFGKVKEENGPIEYTFRFVNNTEEVAEIVEVNASCGCTTPGWTQEKIVPGDTGMVKAQFDPLNRPGKFEKSLTVSYQIGAGIGSAVLEIEGMVKPKPKSIEDELPTLIGNVRFKYKSFNMGRITTKGPVTEVFDVYNEGDTSIVWLIDNSQIPAHVTVQFSPDTLLSQEMGNVSVTYDPNKKADLGYVNDRVVLATNEKESSKKELNLIATIYEFFPPMTDEELAHAPKLVFDKTQHNFDQVKEGNTVVTNFILTNTGQEDLVIRKIKSNCSCVVGKLSDDQIKRGDSVSLEVRFDSSGRKGRQYKTVTVFSNDPTASTQMITLKAEIED